MIRVLQVMGALDCGGAENMIMNIYRKIDKTKIQFDFVVHTEKKCFFEDEIYEMGGKVYRFPRYKLYNHFQYTEAWSEFFKKHKEYKIIHCHIRSVASIILGIAKKSGIITISHSHSTSNGKGISSIIKRILQSKIKYVADYLFACSKESAVWLYGENYANSSRCHIINNAIDVEKFKYDLEIRNEVRKELNLQTDTFAIIQTGRFCNVKNHEFSVKLINEYLKKNKNTKLFFAGSGPEEEKILQLVKEKHLDNNVCFLGVRKDINRILQGMDLFFMPSKYEGLPVALIEAQAASIPCIVSSNIKAGIYNEKIVNSIDLNECLERWIDKIDELKNNNRFDQSEIIVKNKFDINENTKFLQKFYFSIL